MVAENSKELNKAKRLERLKSFQFPKGKSGNPGGRPKKDMAAEIAHAIFEQHPEAIRAAFAKALKKGDARAFTALADRAYGKPAQSLTVDANVNIDIAARRERVRELITSLTGKSE